MLLVSLLLSCAPSTEACAPPGPPAGPPLPHSVATVTDPNSHGVVGDGLLSLNEAILLHNRQLQVSQLSLAEQSQLSGFGTDISWINIDATFTPVITVERDFDLILDFAHGILIQGFNGSAVIDFTGPNVQHGFRSISNYCSWRNLVLQGGPFAIDLQQTDASFGGTVLDNVAFDGQSQFAFATAGTTANGYGRVLFDHCVFTNTPAAIRCDEGPAGRTTILAAFDTVIDAVADGIDAHLGPAGSAILQFDRVEMDVTGTGLRVRRTPGDDRSAAFAATHLEIAGATCLDLQGEPFAPTTVSLYMLHLRATPGGTALRTGPLGGSIHGVVEDSTFAGDCPVLTGRNGLLRLSNCRFAGGTATFGAQAFQALMVRASRFDGCAITSTGQAPIELDACCVVGGSAAGQFASPLQFTGSFLGTSVGANVTSTGALTAEQLGSVVLDHQNAVVGGSVTLGANLPIGLFAVFVLGPTLPAPLFVTPDLHVYLDLGFTVAPGGLFQLQQTTTLPIPLDFALRDTDWVFQAAVLPAPGVSAPALQVPPGGRFVVR